MSADAKTPPLDERVARLVAEAIRHTEYGTVVITIHDGKVQFIEATTRFRLTPTK